MMAASSMGGPNFGGGHPGGMGHPAVAGHSMAPGMPHNAAQQAPGGMPHQFPAGHLGVAAPGGQVNPALMGAMPPGANPHGHPLQHMSPQQQQMLQQQQFQQQFQGNPSTMAAMRQHQQLLQQQQARQAMMAQQMHAANMAPGAGGMPMGMQFNQQLHQLRAQGRLPGQHPQATQALMAQQYAMHQQQQAQQAQAQAAQAQAAQQAAQQQQQQAAQAQQAQQQQQAQQAQQAQAQQAQAQQQQQQQSQHGQQPQPQPGQPSGQPNQMNAQNMQNMQQQNQVAGGQNQMPGQGQGQQAQQGQPSQQQQAQSQQQQQPQPQQPGQQPHHTPQPSQAGTPAPTGAQTPAQTPGSTPAQPSNQPPQTQQVQQHQPQAQPQSQQMGQPQMNPVAAAQQMALQNQMYQQRREAMKGQCLLKLMQFSEFLSGYPGQRGKDDLSYWNVFVARFFSQNGVFRHSLHYMDSDETIDKQYEMSYPAIARYFHTHFSSGVKNMQLIMDKGTADRPLPGDCHFIENQRASFVYWFETGSHLVASGTLRAQFDAEQKIELFEFHTTSHEEYISRKQVIDTTRPVHNWIKEWRTMNAQEAKGSPELNKKGKGRQLRSPQSHPPELLQDLPDSAVNSKGVTNSVYQFLEIVEVMGQMNPLFGFYHANAGMGPYAALEQYVAQNINGPLGPAMNGQPGPANPRTPSFGQFQMGASPNPAHMNLPGSPHVVAGSPAPGHMQSPAMQLQASQQGTSSSGPSANTSPASNKRRRPSGVKAEDDGSGAPTPGSQVNGIQRKPATPRMTKRVKGNP